MQEIRIIGAKKHNLKNIDLRIPKKKLITITGVSGSGKSSLAYDTIFQEGQRKYLESLSIYARQFIKSINKPDVQSIKGISPTISIDQKHSSFFYNSTVGTISEVSQYLRLLYAKVGMAKCMVCKRNIEKYSSENIFEHIFVNFSQKLIRILAPVVRGRKGNYKALFEKYLKRGFLKTLVDGNLYYLESVPELHRNVKHDIAILIDTVKVSKENREQMKESISIATFEGNEEIIIKVDKKEHFFSNKLYCSFCNIALKEPQPATFSFNSPVGACSLCNGTGIDNNGCQCNSCVGAGLNSEALSFYFKGKNIYELGEMELIDLLEFFNNIVLNVDEQKILSPIIPQIIQRLESFIKLNLGYITLNRKIYTLSGGELQRTRLVSQIGFGLSGIIYILDEPSIGMHISEQLNLIYILNKLKEKDNTIIVVEHDKNTINSSDYIIDLGPGSGENGGDIIYSGYYSDFKNAENSLTSDYIFNRKKIVVEKKYKKFLESSTNNKGIENKKKKREFIEVNNIFINNLNNVNLKIPLKSLTVVAGVSGSGKSSLIVDAFYPIIKSKIENTKNKRTKFSNVKGIKKSVGRILVVNQASIGKNSRSCPATYINIMPFIRELYVGLTESKMRGYGQSRFSFNVRGGRCEACKGLGFKKLEMSFLPHLEIECPICEGKRYNSETLLIKYKGLSIADVLELTVNEAYNLFQNIPLLAKRLKVLIDVGLEYLKLGQSSVTLSGGESQRIKLSKELSKYSAKSTIYLLDEPTIGLHFYDIQKLINVFCSFITKGDTIVVIEHNMEIIKAADYIIDLGPGGGKNGGEIIYQGNLNGIKKCRESCTGFYLRREDRDVI